MQEPQSPPPRPSSCVLALPRSSHPHPRSVYTHTRIYLPPPPSTSTFLAPLSQVAWSHQLRINANGRLEHYLDCGDDRYTVSHTSAVTPGVWTHVAGVAVADGEMKLFVDGQEEVRWADVWGVGRGMSWGGGRGVGRGRRRGRGRARKDGGQGREKREGKEGQRRSVGDGRLEGGEVFFLGVWGWVGVGRGMERES